MSPNVKQLSIALALLIIAVAVGIAAYLNVYLPNEHNTDWAGYVRSLPVTKDIAGAEDIPIYPGAEHTEGTTSLRTRANYADVLAFYKAVLPKKGWILARELEAHRGLHFVWKSEAESAPYDQDIVLGRQHVDGYTQIDWTLRRVPVLERVPLHPYAKQVSVEDRTAQHVDVDRTTTYFAQATLDEVEQYYFSELPRHGWALADHTNTGFSSQMTFNYSVGDIDNVLAGEVTITSEPEPGGLTQVEVRARGNNWWR